MTDEERKERRKACMKRYRQKHKAQCQAYGKAYRATHTTVSEHRRAYQKAYLKKRYAENREKILAQMTAHRNANLDEARARARAIAKKAYATNPERIRARTNKYMATEKGRAKYAVRYAKVEAARVARMRRWKVANRPHINAASAARNAAKLRATPTWADRIAIEAVYLAAARLTHETGIQQDVDHIYPLKGRTVCGLHVANNLQVITHIENVRKGNRLMPHTAPPQLPFDAALS